MLLRHRPVAVIKFIEIDGKRYAWHDILKLRRDRVKAARKPQPTLFELKDDSRPASQKTAADRYAEPLLFDE
jgi:hypothetical protein